MSKIETFFDEINRQFHGHDLDYDKAKLVKDEVDLTIKIVNKVLQVQDTPSKVGRLSALIVYKRALDYLSIEIMREASSLIAEVWSL
jgi:hypothetical protein